jgi:glycine betaine/proline transport system substrate-binding protein
MAASGEGRRAVRNKSISKNWLAIWGVCALGLGAGFTPAAAEKLPGEGVTVKMGYTVGLLEERFQNQVVALGLEKLGYKVQEMVQMDVPALHLAVAQGDVDAIAAHWDPLQQAFIDRAGSTNLEMVGNLVPGCLQGYLVDKRTYDEKKVHNLDQLREPEIAKLFSSSGTGKADLAGCPPGWGCERVVEYNLDAYKLRPTVTHHQGQFDVMAADTVTRFKSGQRVLYYTYTPHWISQVLVPGRDVEWLEVPFTALPDKDQMNLNTRLPDGKNLGFPINTMRVVANKRFLDKNPAARKLFEVMTIPVADVNAQNWELHQGKTSYDDVLASARTWVANHQQQFDDWITQATKAVQ